MGRYICCGIIFIYGILLGIPSGITPVFIFCLFLSLSFCGILFLLPEAGLPVISLLWILAALSRPEFLWFLPCLSFHLFLHITETIRTNHEFRFLLRDSLFLLAVTIPILLRTSAFTVYMALGFAFSFLLSGYFAWTLVSYELLHNQFIHSVDEHTEQQLLLKEKNQALLAKQDAEIHAATLKERNRIAREIHDNVGHLLSRSLLMTGAIQTMNESGELREPLHQLDTSLNQAMDSIRNSVHNLHDEALNLEETTRQLVRDFQFCPVWLSYDMGYEPPAAIRYTFLSITKEAMANIIKHSNATHVKIVMREHPSLYQLEIADNGTKIRESFAKNAGIGLTNMQERVSQLHGIMTLSANEGFRIFITIPKSQ